MFAYLFEIVIVLLFLVLLFFVFRALIRSPGFAAWVGETVDTSDTDAETFLSVAEDKAQRQIAADANAATALAAKSNRLKKRVGRNQFE